MAEPISIQQLKDASLDVKSLEEVVNGDENVVVTTRLGETYPSVKGSIKKVFEAGGLPATPFATKALMTASSLVDGDYAMVTNDTVNNGLYVKTAGSWVKSDYDPKTQAVADSKTYTDSAITTAMNKSSGTFDTLALLTASALVDNSYALVANDTDLTKNGYYKKVSGVWAKVKYDPVTQAKSYTDEKAGVASRLITENQQKPLVQMSDSRGNIFLEVDASANLNITNMKSSVQKTIANIPAQVSGGGDLVQFVDESGSVIIRQSKRGDLFLPNMSGSVQAALGGSKVAGYRSKNLRDRVSDIAKPFILDLVANQEDYVPPPMCLIPNKYNIPNSFVNAFTVTVPSYTSLDSVYGVNDYNVHSHLIEFPRPFRGYRYFMANTPYSSTAHENPLVYGSNDLITFDLLDGMPQPLDQPRTGDIYNFRADVGFTYDPIEGDLICTWISVAQGTNPEWEGFWYSRTKDGYTWTEPRQIKLSEGGTPALLYNMETNLWHIWHLEGVGQVRHSTAPTIEGPWTDVSFGTIRPTPESAVWHLEVKFMGNKLVMVANTAKPEENLYLGVSDDWDTWQWGKALLAPKQEGIYKGGFLPEFDGDKLTLLMIWNTNITNDPKNTRRLFINRTNTINLSELI